MTQSIDHQNVDASNRILIMHGVLNRRTTPSVSAEGSRRPEASSAETYKLAMTAVRDILPTEVPDASHSPDD